MAKLGLSREEAEKLNATASNPMIMFLVLNTSGLTLIPVSILVYRAQMGAAQPTDIFIPILIATTIATLSGIIVTSLYQKINLLNRAILGTMLGENFFEEMENGEFLPKAHIIIFPAHREKEMRELVEDLKKEGL